MRLRPVDSFNNTKVQNDNNFVEIKENFLIEKPYSNSKHIKSKKHVVHNSTKFFESKDVLMLDRTYSILKPFLDFGILQNDFCNLSFYHYKKQEYVIIEMENTANTLKYGIKLNSLVTLKPYAMQAYRYSETNGKDSQYDHEKFSKNLIAEGKKKFNEIGISTPTKVQIGRLYMLNLIRLSNKGEEDNINYVYAAANTKLSAELSLLISVSNSELDSESIEVLRTMPKTFANSIIETLFPDTNDDPNAF